MVDYYESDAVGRSNILLAHREDWPMYRATYIDKIMPPMDETRSMRIGLLSHVILMEPEKVFHGYACYDGRRDIRIKEYKSFLDANAGKVILNPKEWAEAMRCGKALGDKLFMQVAKSEQRFRELDIYWQDAVTGMELKAKPDIVLHFGDRILIIDIKTAGESQTKHSFGYSAREYGYNFQDVHYTEGVKRRFGINNVEFIFVTVETFGLNKVKVFRLDEQTREEVTRRRRWCIDEICRRTKENDWSDPHDVVQTVYVGA